MRPGIAVEVTAADRDRLTAIVADRNSPQKHVWRAAIVLATADGLGTAAIMRRTGKSKTAVWRWQERFAAEGVEGLRRDKTRPSRIAPFGPEVGERIVALTLAEPPGETTHWTGRAMAKAAGVSLSYVQRIWRSHGLQPHRIRTFKLSNDPAFAAKVRDIVGLYLDPPAHAVVLSIDEKLAPAAESGRVRDRGGDSRGDERPDAGARCMTSTACCSSLLIGTKRMEGRLAASQIAAASAASFFPRLR